MGRQKKRKVVLGDFRNTRSSHEQTSILCVPATYSSFIFSTTTARFNIYCPYSCLQLFKEGNVLTCGQGPKDLLVLRSFPEGTICEVESSRLVCGGQSDFVEFKITQARNTVARVVRAEGCRLCKENERERES